MWTTRARRRAAAGLAALALAASGCVEHAMREAWRPREYPPPAYAPEPQPTDGAIWRGSTASGSFLYFDRKARGVGDLVTVLVLENLSAAGSASTDLDKQSSLQVDLSSQVGFTELLLKAADAFFGLFGVDAPGADPTTSVNVVQGSSSSGFAGDGETTREGSFNAVVTCRVVDVLPGGIFHIHGRRQLIVNHELQLVTVEGLVRREDISIHNTVPSTVLADARLTYDGIGVIDDKQRPSLLARLVDWVYPF